MRERGGVLMKIRKLKAGMIPESDTEYRFEGTVLDIGLADTMVVNDLSFILTNKLYEDTHIAVAFLLRGLHNVILDFGGAVMRMHGIMQPFLIQDCENVTVRNVSVEYDRGYVSEMQVLETGERYFRAKLGENFPCVFEDGQLYPVAEHWKGVPLNRAPCFFQSFDSVTHEGTGIYLAVAGKDIRIDETLPWAKSTFRLAIEEGENGTLVFRGDRVPPYRAGDIVEFCSGNRYISSLAADRTKGLTIENYRIINGIGMGIQPTYCEDIAIRGLRMYCDGNSKGVVSNAADGIHATACRGRFEILDSVLEGMVDDALNIHSLFYAFEYAEANQMTVGNRSCQNVYNTVFGKGDVIAVHRGHTPEETGRYTVLDVKISGESSVMLTLDRPVLEHEPEDAVENLSAQPDILIDNCRIGKANSHMRFQSRGKCVIRNSETELPAILTGDMNYWYESSPCSDITFENVRFAGKNAKIKAIPEFTQSIAAPFYHTGIRILCCEFTEKDAIELHYADRIVLQGNYTADGGAIRAILDCCGNNVETDGSAIAERVDNGHHQAY